MVGGLREKQYQLAAQKRNDAFLKHDYHVRAAKYFELQSGNAKQYDSWNLKKLDPNGEIEKAEKAKTLLLRRNKLRNLLEEEKETYAEELTELKSQKKERDEITLDETWQEKRAKDKIYPDDMFRKCHSYYWDPKDSRSETSSVKNNSATDSGLPRKIDASNAQTFQLQANESPKLLNRKYSERYSRRSLDNTNVRSDYCYSEKVPLRKEKDTRYATIEEDTANSLSTYDAIEEAQEEDERKDSSWKRSSPQSCCSLLSQEVLSSRDAMEQQSTMYSKKTQFYFAQKEINENIEDLAKKELHACSRQKWDEALRLRDMRNRLEVMLQKKLYETKLLQMDEETRKVGLENVERWQNELAKRENVCTDSTIYSDEAKVLWKKWVQEDDRSVIKEARFRRENLMKELEQEFQILPTREKERIAGMYHNAIRDSYVHDNRNPSASLMETKMMSLAD